MEGPERDKEGLKGKRGDSVNGEREMTIACKRKRGQPERGGRGERGGDDM